MSEFAIEMRHVTKRFPNPSGGEVTAVDRVTLQIGDGEFFSLLGPSGCGKTTTLRMIAGFEWPTEGDIYLKGQPVGRTPPFLRPVNTVFQSYALFQHMTVSQNVAFGLEMEHTPKPEIARRVGEALELVQLGGMGPRKPKQLSGGQQQRVALARALVKRPAVLLLDEPLGALDLKLRKEMQLELKALQMQVGITFIYVTHDQQEALTMSNRIAVMSKGKALQIGSPVGIYERPNCRFVADFIGETNFLEGTVKELDDQMATVIVKELGTEVVGLRGADLHVGQAAVVCVRPEKIRLIDRCAAQSNCFPVNVITSAYIGSDTRIVVDLGHGARLTIWDQNKVSTLDNQAFYAPGAQAWVAWLADNALVLPEG
jgi:spermidine/putrescine transport system ATP-binding protein